jgi:hypothetical protein
MNAKQKNHIIRTIKGDASAVGEYVVVDDDGKVLKACVIGGLAIEAGVLLRTLLNRNTESISDIPLWSPVIQKINKLFGLTLTDLVALQNVNDWNEHTPTRHKKLIEKVNEIYLDKRGKKRSNKPKRKDSK